MSKLKAHITADMKSAMKAKDKDALKAIRAILGAVKQKEIDERIELEDGQVLSIIQKMIKQRKDSITQFSDAGRLDLVAVEEGEIAIISHYMPEQLSEAEIATAIDEAIAQTGASSMADMGQLMGLLKAQLSGKAEMGVISSMIKQKLT